MNPQGCEQDPGTFSALNSCLFKWLEDKLINPAGNVGFLWLVIGFFRLSSELIFHENTNSSIYIFVFILLLLF